MFDRQKCAGHGICALEAPAVFDVEDETGLAVLLEADPGDDGADAVRRAARGCPERAITVE
ncbi:ferredoxin [Actinocorallia aurea]